MYRLNEKLFCKMVYNIEFVAKKTLISINLNENGISSLIPNIFDKICFRTFNFEGSSHPFNIDCR